MVLICTDSQGMSKHVSIATTESLVCSESRACLDPKSKAPAVEDEDGFRDAAELPVWQTVGEEGGRNRICFKISDLVNRALKMQMPLADTC
ncbi:hypothetical protein NC651_005448 [Populus alba x Populus x berolinensis]|nr:hypothetical protein NC651_005448 [Populus alba x Populus x berolinensis]